MCPVQQTGTPSVMLVMGFCAFQLTSCRRRFFRDAIQTSIPV